VVANAQILSYETWFRICFPFSHLKGRRQIEGASERAAEGKKQRMKKTADLLYDQTLRQILLWLSNQGRLDRPKM
jgi:hypothetical protein